MPTEQGLTSMKGRRIISTGDFKWIIARNQYQYHRTFTKIEWNRCYSGHCESIYKDDQIKGNDNKHIIQRNCEDLSKQHVEVTWNTQENSQ